MYFCKKKRFECNFCVPLQRTYWNCPVVVTGTVRMCCCMDHALSWLSNQMYRCWRPLNPKSDQVLYILSENACLLWNVILNALSANFMRFWVFGVPNFLNKQSFPKKWAVTEVWMTDKLWFDFDNKIQVGKSVEQILSWNLEQSFFPWLAGFSLFILCLFLLVADALCQSWFGNFSVFKLKIITT